MQAIKKQIWTNLDAFGLLNGISTWDNNYLNLKYVRIPGESNIELRNKINKFADTNNPLTGNLEQELIIGLANELNLESYTNTERTTFNLSRFPYAYGDKRVQDIWLYYQPIGATDWIEVTPQFWSEDIENDIPTSGFIVWENSYYNSINTNRKDNEYSRLLEIYSNLPNEVRLKIVYYIEQLDIDNNKIYTLFSDIGNRNNNLFYLSEYQITKSDLNIKPVVYSLSKIPNNLSGYYYNSNGKPTDLLYKLRDKIDMVYRHRWDSIADKVTIWDINLNFSKGSIPSFYDTPFSYNSGIFEITNFMTGGVNYYNTSLYINDIDIIIENDKEYWYPKLQTGPLYINGKNYYLMQNPIGILLDFSTGITSLPFGIEIYHKTILNMNQITPKYEYFYKDADYNISYYNVNTSGIITTKINSEIANKKAYLTNDMGFVKTLNAKEYAIDYQNKIIYSSGIITGILYYDNVLVPESVTIKSTGLDLNPLNDTTIGYDEYFIVVGE